MSFDVEALREKLMDYYGTAMCSGFPMAVIDLSDVETADPEELLAMARRAGISPDEY